MKKWFLRFHLWLSVPFGIVIFLLCFSGAMLVFEREITEALCPELYRVDSPAGAQPLPLGELAERAAAALPEGVEMRGITAFPDDPSAAYRAALSSPPRASLMIDPYTGEVKGVAERPAFFRFMFGLHRWLLDSRPEEEGGIFWGKMVVGVSTIAFLLVLLTGIVVWWPRTKRALGNSLKLTLRKGRFPLWRSLHVAGGMYALLLLLVMCLTGLTWSFAWYRNAFYALFGVEAARTVSAHGASSGARGGGESRGKAGRTASVDFSRWQEVYERLAAAHPEYWQIQVGDGTATAQARRFGNTRAADRYRFAPSTGEILEAGLYRDAREAGPLRGWIYSVHVGSWGGLPMRCLYFLTALFGASLPLTGYYLWIRRLRRKRRGAYSR